jgi:hypothetical protein
VETILEQMRARPTLDGTDEPLRVYLTCYRVLSASQDPRAGEVLDAAYRLLQERATHIDDEDLRRSFLENVAAHREIVRLHSVSRCPHPFRRGPVLAPPGQDERGRRERL